MRKTALEIEGTIAYNNPTLLGSKLINAISIADNRADAWFEIR
jgi:hypothetical protein